MERPACPGAGRSSSGRCALRSVRRRAVVDDPLLDDAATGAATRTPDEQRDDEAECAGDHQDDADGLDAHARYRRVDGEREDGADSDEENADADAHGWLTPVVGGRRWDSRPRGEQVIPTSLQQTPAARVTYGA